MQLFSRLFILLLFLEGENSQIHFNCVHDGLNELFEQCIKQGGLLLIFLEDEAYSLLDFLVGETLES